MTACAPKEELKAPFPYRQDESQLTNGYLNTRIDWIEGRQGFFSETCPGLPTFVRTLDRDGITFNFCKNEAQAVTKCSDLVLNTFEELDL
ncbi:hypothetical protein EJ110_NYTH12572 [Nymphaea thermarum]|nr:hypothetical protein EJ110_NYTH12572 [Nymphaea thermarum]